MKTFLHKEKTWVFNGNEHRLQLMINLHRWFLPLGIQGRKTSMFGSSGSIQKRISIGILCFMFIYTRYNGLSLYTASIIQF